MAAADCVLKLGGSALTHKGRRESARDGALRSAAGLVRELCAAGAGRCIVVHGAGSFGHFQAKAHGLASGSPTNSESLRQGLCLTRISVTKLNHMVTEQLVMCGVPAVGISPFGAWRTAGRKITQAGIAAIRDSLEAGYIPVLHGDCVLDSEQHCSILSGDTIIEVLSREFSPKRVVFLTDVDGIYDRPPDTPGATLVDSIAVNADGSIDPPVLTSALPHDVTGGLALKLQTAINIVTQSNGSIPVLICKLESEVAKRACLTGELRTGEGTKLFLRQTEETTSVIASGWAG
ncbi:glutamate 5-kinase-like [Alligator mississippiensis]|uniref:Isopentenyl phosphate kinase n=1 Tax=Alligator mississippiensis TaxID=8496 RepID=A0A151N8T7_ALLMI|nr:glutamate 5-kinase-like [Alligator mississippiensis]